jgi:hypothetical protein
VKHRILVVTDRIDPHADRLITVLRQHAAEPLRLNISEVPISATLAFALDKDTWAGEVRLETNGRVLDTRDLTSVWWRRPGWYTFPSDMQAQEQEFASEETDHCLSGIWSALDCYWVSHPENIRRASYKIEQLQRAVRLGFEVPRTVVTTSPGTARAFFDECDGQMVYKVLSDPFLSARHLLRRGHPDPIRIRAVVTTQITPDTLHLLDSVRSVPCLFQELIRKRSDLRVTVIGSEVFAVEIFLQEHEDGCTDHREHGPGSRYRAMRLPDELAARCVELTRSYGLNFSAIDLLRTDDGRDVFMEINPNGQFLHLQERLPELRLDDAMAACLIRGGNG